MIRRLIDRFVLWRESRRFEKFKREIGAGHGTFTIPKEWKSFSVEMIGGGGGGSKGGDRVGGSGYIEFKEWPIGVAVGDSKPVVNDRGETEHEVTIQIQPEAFDRKKINFTREELHQLSDEPMRDWSKATFGEDAGEGDKVAVTFARGKIKIEIDEEEREAWVRGDGSIVVIPKPPETVTLCQAGVTREIRLDGPDELNLDGMNDRTPGWRGSRKNT